jgi:hypothetical protein
MSHNESRPLPRPISVATLFLALVGLAMAIYLVTVRSSANLQSENSEEVSMAQALRKRNQRNHQQGERSLGRSDSRKAKEYFAIQTSQPFLGWSTTAERPKRLE